MKKLILLCLTAAVLTGCATSPTSVAQADAPVYATPAERAYQMGLEYNMILTCRAELGDARVAQYAQSAELLLTSYPQSWRGKAQSAFQQGLATGPARFHRIPCEGIKSLIIEQMACNDAETRKNLKAAARLN